MANKGGIMRSAVDIAWNRPASVAATVFSSASKRCAVPESPSKLKPVPPVYRRKTADAVSKTRVRVG